MKEPNLQLKSITVTLENGKQQDFSSDDLRACKSFISESLGGEISRFLKLLAFMAAFND